MDFVSGLPKSSECYDFIWVTVDRMTKSAYFLPIKTIDPVRKLATLYLKEIARLHGVSVSMVSDRDVRLISIFWKELQTGFSTRLEFNTASHPQTNG